MPLSPQQGKTVTVLLLTFVFVVLGAVYFKAESGASSVITMSGEKSLAIYKTEVARREEAAILAMKALEEVDIVATTSATTTPIDE